ncbi:rhodanese-like domain-containing protein [Caldisalinibacter kiritimatiensis]|uniref:Rhodanese domain-containing protein n=1 Tax=Caldisalinibacter kiritimatiensis TaxID=1304284 RepID=R1CRB1_9FIRM|nr:rhodanese-like domain-containing protein [Caldisalinibacter kiritimatiensis]EOD01221.1 hypothetical protein L21TH_0697 [Caldisalinibacter kiritimatiensis]
MFRKFKLTSLILVLALILSLAGCTTDKEPATNTEPAKNTEQSTNESDVLAQVVSDYYTNMGSDIYKISQKEFVDKVKAGEDMFILDIRQPDVYNEGHIKGAVNAPWGTAISENLDKLPKSKPIMVYCYTGQTAGQTVALLNMAGFDAKSVNLGWNLGISKVEGVEEVIETTANEFGQPTGVEIQAEIKDAINKYFAGLADVKGTTYANYKISEDNAKKLLDQEDNSVIFLSIRKAEHYNEGHIQGAINIPFGKEMHKEFNTLPKDKKIIVYCYTGQTAGQTVAALRLIGYDAVSLNGGTGMKANAPFGWTNKGYELVK